MNKKMIVLALIAFSAMSSSIAASETLEAQKKENCDYYREKISRYDAMARQPQSGSTQDRIREEITRIRKLQDQEKCHAIGIR